MTDNNLSYDLYIIIIKGTKYPLVPRINGTAVSFRSKFSGFHLENITCPVRYLRVPLGSCQSVILRRIFVLHVSTGRGGEARHTMQRCTSPCTKPRDTIRSDGGQAYGMERSSAVILRVPFLSADFQFPRI